MNKIDDKVALLLELPLPDKNGEIQLTDAHKQLISEIGEMCNNIPLVQDTKEQAEKYAEGVTAEQVYVDMLHKIVEAPTRLHMRAVVRMLIPIIDKKLKGGRDIKNEEALVQGVEFGLDNNLYVDPKDIEKYKEITSRK